MGFRFNNKGDRIIFASLSDLGLLEEQQLPTKMWQAGLKQGSFQDYISL